MPFPPNWIQVFVDYPVEDPVREFRSTLLWFRVTPHTPAETDPSWLTWETAFWAWWMAGVGGQVACTIPLQFGGYVFPSSFPGTGLSLSAGPFVARIENTLPGKNGVVIHRNDFHSGPNGYGRIAIPNVAISDTDGNALTLAAFNNWQAASQQFSVSIHNAGFNFLPIIASYKFPSNVGVARVTVSQRLGCMRRRARPFSHPIFVRIPAVPP